MVWGASYTYVHHWCHKKESQKKLGGICFLQVLRGTRCYHSTTTQLCSVKCGEGGGQIVLCPSHALSKVGVGVGVGLGWSGVGLGWGWGGVEWGCPPPWPHPVLSSLWLPETIRLDYWHLGSLNGGGGVYYSWGLFYYTTYTNSYTAYN